MLTRAVKSTDKSHIEVSHTESPVTRVASAALADAPKPISARSLDRRALKKEAHLCKQHLKQLKAIHPQGYAIAKKELRNNQVHINQGLKTGYLTVDEIYAFVVKFKQLAKQYDQMPTVSATSSEPIHASPDEVQMHKSVLKQKLGELKTAYPKGYITARRETQSDFERIIRSIVDQTSDLPTIYQYMHVLEGRCQIHQEANSFSSLFRSKNFDKCRMWYCSQSVQFDRSLGLGTCFASSATVAAYLTRNPNASAFEIYHYMAGDETQTFDGSEIFRSQDRFSQAKYLLNNHLSKKTDTAPSKTQILGDHGLIQGSKTKLQSPPTPKAGAHWLLCQMQDNQARGMHQNIFTQSDGTSGHAIEIHFDPSQNIYRLFDADRGFYEFPDMETLGKFLETYFQERYTSYTCRGCYPDPTKDLDTR